LVALVVTVVVTRLAAIVVSKQFEEGSEVSDEFRRLTVLGGLEFSSRAGGLRSGEVGVALGGTTVDLRDATLDPAGATILLENTLGGLMLLVRDDWAVTVDDTVIGGGQTEVEVTPPTELPPDAPRLQVQVVTRLGGTVVTTDAGRIGSF
jgi:predicted membrane protein